MSANPFILPLPTVGSSRSSSNSARNSPIATSPTTKKMTASTFSISRPNFHSPGYSSSDPSFTYSPPSHQIDLMNYSPKHSRKPSSLSSSRNINMKNLSLNLKNEYSPPRDDDSSSTHSVDSLPFSKHNLVKRKTLTLSIPSDESEMPLVTPAIAQTPIAPPQLKNSPALASSKAYTFPSTSSDQFNLHMNQANHFKPQQTAQNLGSPFLLNDPLKVNAVPVPARPNNQTTVTPKRKQIPEELQEKSQLDAYPNGPADVLNGSIFLYSDPAMDESIDINEFDLVINVAKECEDLSYKFAANSNKEYLYIPWSHTSSILKKLPYLTEKILQYDDSHLPPNLSSKRKILVHCQCGVSRSACVVVAYFMKKFKMSVNEAYELLKLGTANINEPVNQSISNTGYSVDACDRICPNMSLIFELMDFGESLEHV